MKIALLLDNPERDLPGLALVAARLAASGARAFLVPMNLAEPEIGALAPDLVLLNFVRRTNEAQIARLQCAGVRTALLDTEGGVLDGFEPYEQIMARSPDVRERIRPFLAWGPRIGEHARLRGWYPDASIRATGHPRFDLYAEPWRSVAAAEGGARIDALIEPTVPVVLVAGTFTLANPRFSTPERECRMLVEQLGLDSDYVEHRLECERRALHGLVSLASLIARRHPEVAVVLRPHPFENDQEYRRLLDGQGVHVIRGGPVHPWLLRARALIQRGSTTAVEAVLAGVPVLEPRWLPAWARLDVVEAASSPWADAEELLGRLDALLASSRPDSGGAPADGVGRVFPEWFAPVDGRAHERVAAALLEALDQEGPKVGLEACRRLHYPTGTERGPNGKLRLSTRLRMAARLPRSFSFRRFRELPLRPGWESSGKAFDATSVARWVEAVAPEVSPGFRPAVRPARETGAYGVTFRSGRSVEVCNP